MEKIPRLAKNSDKEHVLNFCEKTFSWGDYIHEVWDSWIDEGNLIVIEQNGIPISMTHAAFYPDEKMIWIEGIRVNKNFRNNGIAQKMINHLEDTAKSQNCTIARMLIDSINLDSQNSHFIESWRWIPLTDDRLKKLDSENKIFCQKDNEKLITLGIITESQSFENTIILEILSGKDSEQLIKYTQNLAYQKNYSKVRILTELESLPSIHNLENKFPF